MALASVGPCFATGLALGFQDFVEGCLDASEVLRYLLTESAHFFVQRVRKLSLSCLVEKADTEIFWLEGGKATAGSYIVAVNCILWYFVYLNLQLVQHTYISQRLQSAYVLSLLGPRIPGKICKALEHELCHHPSQSLEHHWVVNQTDWVPSLHHGPKECTYPGIKHGFQMNFIEVDYVQWFSNKSVQLIWQNFQASPCQDGASAHAQPL